MKRKKSTQSAKNRHLNPKETFHLEQEILDAVIRYCEDSVPRVTRSAFYREAIVDALKKLGRWR